MPQDFTQLALAIQQMEGYRPGTVAYRNNNPGNLIYVGQPGAVRGENGFAKFASYEAGLEALKRQLGLYAGRGMTIESMFEAYAPRGHGNNDPTAYANFVSSQLGVPPGTPLTDLAPSGATWSVDVYGTGYNPAPSGAPDLSWLFGSGAPEEPNYLWLIVLGVATAVVLASD
jgi:hypothetical protein